MALRRRLCVEVMFEDGRLKYVYVLYFMLIMFCYFEFGMLFLVWRKINNLEDFNPIIINRDLVVFTLHVHNLDIHN